MAKLADAGDYFGIQQYATRALEVKPGNVKVHYWLIYGMYHLGSVEMAWSEVERSKAVLTSEEYDALVKFLKQGKELIQGDLLDEELYP